jgi:hypothetical protein
VGIPKIDADVEDEEVDGNKRLRDVVRFELKIYLLF